MDWKLLNNTMSDTWCVEDDGTADAYLHSNKEAKEIMSELRVNGMVQVDDDVPDISWDRFDRMSDATAEWLYKKCLRLVEIKRS